MAGLQAWDFKKCLSKVMNERLRGHNNMRWGYSAFAASPVMGSGPLQLVFHSFIPFQETPTNHFKFVGREKKRRACCSALGPVYRRGWTRSRLAKHWGPLNTSERPQLYARPSESQQSAENQNDIKMALVGANFRILATRYCLFVCLFVLSEGWNLDCLKGLPCTNTAERDNST